MYKSTLNKLLLSRSMYYLAKDHITPNSGLRVSIACNLLQDSVETFLLAIAEKVDADIKDKTNYAQYFDLINDQIKPIKLPFRTRLIQLNKMRVSTKHYGVEPSFSEVDRIKETVWEFFLEVSRSVLDTNFATLSLSDLLPDGETKSLVQQAELALKEEDYEACLVKCRQAIYTKFEWQYDVSIFEKSRPPLFLAQLGCRAPGFARNPEYIEKYVKDPTEYIVYDHSTLELDLLKRNVDSVLFWNIVRLTPCVYRPNTDSPWFVKREFDKVDKDGLKDRAEYVFGVTEEILIADNETSNRTKIPGYNKFFIKIKRNSIPIYSKASKESPIKGHGGPQGTVLFTDYSVQGFKNSEVFWHVTSDENDNWFLGFVHDDDVIVEYFEDEDDADDK